MIRNWRWSGIAAGLALATIVGPGLPDALAQGVATVAEQPAWSDPGTALRETQQGGRPTLVVALPATGGASETLRASLPALIGRSCLLVEVDSDEQGEWVRQLGITGLPGVALYAPSKDGIKLLGSKSGMADPARISGWVYSLIRPSTPVARPDSKVIQAGYQQPSAQNSMPPYMAPAPAPSAPCPPPVYYNPAPAPAPAPVYYAPAPAPAPAPVYYAPAPAPAPVYYAPAPAPAPASAFTSPAPAPIQYNPPQQTVVIGPQPAPNVVAAAPSPAPAPAAAPPQMFLAAPAPVAPAPMMAMAPVAPAPMMAMAMAPAPSLAPAPMQMIAAAPTTQMTTTAQFVAAAPTAPAASPSSMVVAVKPMRLRNRIGTSLGQFLIEKNKQKFDLVQTATLASAPGLAPAQTFAYAAPAPQPAYCPPAPAPDYAPEPLPPLPSSQGGTCYNCRTGQCLKHRHGK